MTPKRYVYISVMGRKDQRARVFDRKGPWAITECGKDVVCGRSVQRYSVTHVPTGDRAFDYGVTLKTARRALSAFARLPKVWATIKFRTQLTPEMRAQGRALWEQLQPRAAARTRGKK